MITIGKDFIGFGKVVDKDQQGVKVRKYELCVNKEGIYLITQPNLCNPKFLWELDWVYVLLWSLVINVVLITCNILMFLYLL